MASALRTVSLYSKSIQPLFNRTATFWNLLSHDRRSNIETVGSVRFMSLQQQFEDAKVKVNKLSEDPGNETKLKMYGLFKQATEGPVKSERPGMMDFVGRAKWDAWNINGKISKEAAQQKYIELVDSLVKKDDGSQESTQEDAGQKYKQLLVECDGALRKIILNRPKKFNALTFDMYGEWVDALKDAENDPRTVLTAVTGAGSYYCSGNDLSNFTNVSPDKMEDMANNGKAVLKRFVGSFIDFPKPLVAVINGPAVGVSVTTLGLFDAVYSTDKATFHTPFTSLGQTPEGCSSVIFPRMMGYGKASEMLFFNKKITADEACQLGLVTEVFPDSTFQTEIWSKLQELSKLPVRSLIYSKELVRGLDKETLHKINEKECERLRERWVSEDCINAIMAFFNRKK